IWGHPFPSCRGSQNGPRREGFASPRNAGAPLTAAGRSERTPPSKRERGRVKSNQTTAVLALFPPPSTNPAEKARSRSSGNRLHGRRVNGEVQYEAQVDRLL